MVAKRINYVEPVVREAGRVEAEQIEFLDASVRFSLKHCNTKNYCIRLVTDNEAMNKLYKRLGYFESMTWGQIKTIAREDGISVEKKDSENHKQLSREYDIFTSFGHFRVNNRNMPTFRVFGAISNGLFYILKFDPTGSINH
jgi:hypothetical protein